MFLFGPPNIEKMQTKRNIKGLIRALGYRKDNSVRRAAATALGQLGDLQALQPLMVMLEDGNSSVRQSAAEALGKLKDPSVVEPLIAKLQDSDSSVRQSTASALGQIGDTRAVAPLVASLTDRTNVVRQSAAEALGKIRDARAVEPLVAALKDKDKSVCQSIEDALEEIGWQPQEDELSVRYWIAKADWVQCIKVGALAVDPLIKILNDPDRLVRQSAIETLGKIKDARAVKPLIAALKDGDQSVRESADHALQEIGWKPGKDELSALYWIAKSDWARCIKVGALAVGPLTEVLKDTSVSVRQSAVDALVRICMANDLSFDVVLKHSNSAVRRAALEALVKTKDVRTVEPLTVALHDSDSWVVVSAARALAEMGSGALAVKPLLKILKDGNGSPLVSAAEILVQIEGDRAIEPLSAALERLGYHSIATKSERKTIVTVLGKIGNSAAIPLLSKSATNDVSDGVRRRATRSIEWIKAKT